jgi:hypothetical protein
MPKTKISEFSATPANNTDIDSINLAEGCAPSGINDALRELMAQLKDFQTGAVGDSFNGPIGTSTAAAGAFTTLSASSTATLSGLTASTALALDASKNIVSVTNTGTGSNVLATSPTLVTPILGTPTSATLTNATGLPIGTGVSGLGTGVATALAVNVGTAGAPVVNGGVLGTPSSGTVTNLTGTASININGTVGATTANTGAFTTLAASSTVTLSGGTANGVTYLNGSKVLTSGSALTFDGTNLGVGVTTAGAKLDLLQEMRVSFANASAYRFRITNTDGNPILAADGTSASMVFQTETVERMRLTSTGLGIGTSSPASKLHVVGTSGSASVRLGTAAGSNEYQSITYGGAAGGSEYGWQVGRSSNTSGLGGDGAFYFYDIFANANRMSIDTSGNLGLGVTPSAWNSSLRAQQFGARGAIYYDSGYYGEVGLVNNGYWAAGSADNWRYTASGGTAALYKQNQGVHSWSSAASGTAGNAISFTQAMTLTAGGDLMVGKTSSAFGTAGIEIFGEGYGLFTASGDASLNTNRLASDGDTVKFYRQTSLVGSISVTTTLTSYNVTSDYRLKNTIAPMTGALAKVALLKPCTYKWNVNGSDGEGFIAHELAEVVPHAVTGAKDAVDADGNPVHQAIDVSFLVATLTAAIQEQQAMIESLRQRLSAANL